VNGNGERLIVKAVYKFKASNNDELSFKKGDLVTVTQKEEGGWWEGTSHESGKTGWFPSNYVKIHSTELVAPAVFTFDNVNNGNMEGDCNNALQASEGFDVEVMDKQLVYRQQLIAELIENEKDFVLELKTLLTNYLEPLRKSGDILSESEYRQLAGNLDEIIEVHNRLQLSLEEGENTVSASSARPHTPQNQSRIGRILLSHGAVIKSAHTTYWANHPKAVCIFEKYRDGLDKFMEAEGANKPGLMVLTTGLSKPFRHLERYAGLMQEVEQHLSDDHPDRGDTQRSIGFYKNIASECAKIRRQKELELEVLTGSIRGWEGESDISSLGDIIHMGSVAVGPDHKDRYLVLFHQNLLLLSVSSRMSAFIYEGKLPLSGIAVNRLEDTDIIRNSFEITGPMIDRILCVCQTKGESLKWVDHLRQQIKSSRQPSQGPNVSNTSLLGGHIGPTSGVGGLGNPPPPPHKSVPLSPGSQKRSINHSQIGNDKGYLWKMSCLRPAPPTRSYLSQPGDPTGGAKRSSGSTKKDPDTTYEEDMQILRVIEAYCVSSAPKNRQTIANSVVIDNLANLSVDEERSKQPPDVQRNSKSDDRELTDLVKNLREQLQLLKDQNRNLKGKVEEEVQARKRLENILKNNVLPNRNDIEWNED